MKDGLDTVICQLDPNYEFLLVAMDTSDQSSDNTKGGEMRDDHNNNMDTGEENEKGERRRSSTGVQRCDSREDFPGKLDERG